MLKKINSFFKGNVLFKTILVLSSIGIILYANTFFNQFFWDDNESIVNNYYIKDWQYFPNYFSENLTAGAGVGSNYWRPLLLFSFSIDYKLGNLTPFIYHLQNLFWHIFSAILVFKLLKIILRKIPEEKSNFIAFLTALLFLIHPLQTEAVTYVAGRADPMHSAFMLLSLIYFANFLQTKNKHKYFYAILFFILSLLIKERAIIFCGLIFFYLLFFYGKTFFSDLKNKLLYFLPFLLVTLSYLILRITVLHFSNTFDLGAQENIGAENLYQKILIILKGFAIYNWLIFWPIKLFMEKTISVPKTFFSFDVIAGFLIFFSWLTSIFYFFKKNHYIAFGLIWFLMALSPSIHVFPIQGLLYEHWLYFPILGFFLAFSFLIYKLIFQFNNKYWQLFFIFLFTVWLLFLSIRTIIRNNDWRNPVKFYEKNISLGGESSRIYTNLGIAYAENGEMEKAIANYKKAIELEPDIFPPWYNLGNVYRDLNQLDKAIECYQKSAEINPDFSSSYINLAIVYSKQRNYQNAINILKKGIKKNPENIELYYNLGIIYYKSKDKENAIKYLNEASKLNSHNLEIMNLIWKIKNSP